MTQPVPEVNSIATDTAFAVFALSGWLVVVPVVGYLVFRQRDLL